MENFEASTRLFFANFELDTGRRALCRDGQDLHLTPKEYQALALLVRNAGKAVSRESLMNEVWPETSVGDTSLSRCVSCLRKHLGTEAIQAVPKFGYRFTLPLTAAALQSVVQPAFGTAQSLPAATSPVAVGRRWAFGLAAMAALLLLRALPFARPVARLWLQPAGTWTDPQTRLMWQLQDNGAGAPRSQADVTRAQAAAYCAALRLNDRRNWRLPTIEELQTLYDPARSSPGLWGGYRPVYWHVKGGLLLSGGETASDPTFLTDQTPAGEEQSYDFSYGRRNYDPIDFKPDHRALCVRTAW